MAELTLVRKCVINVRYAVLLTANEDLIVIQMLHDLGPSYESACYNGFSHPQRYESVFLVSLFFVYQLEF